MTDDSYDLYLEKYISFDWSNYLINYIHLTKLGFDDKEKTWWHYLYNKDTYLYFDMKNRDEYITQKNNFDHEIYLEMYPFIINQNYKTPDEIWWHYFNI